SATVGSNTVDEEFAYSYISGGGNDGLLSSVLLHRRDNGGAWGIVRKVSYTYYGNDENNGNLGDLKTATIKDAAGNTLETTYYRYYTQADIDNSANGYVHGLKY